MICARSQQTLRLIHSFIHSFLVVEVGILASFKSHGPEQQLLRNTVQPIVMHKMHSSPRARSLEPSTQAGPQARHCRRSNKGRAMPTVLASLRDRKPTPHHQAQPRTSAQQPGRGAPSQKDETTMPNRDESSSAPSSEDEAQLDARSSYNALLGQLKGQHRYKDDNDRLRSALEPRKRPRISTSASGQAQPIVGQMPALHEDHSALQDRGQGSVGVGGEPEGSGAPTGSFAAPSVRHLGR